MRIFENLLKVALAKYHFSCIIILSKLTDGTLVNVGEQFRINTWAAGQIIQNI